MIIANYHKNHICGSMLRCGEYRAEQKDEMKGECLSVLRVETPRFPLFVYSSYHIMCLTLHMHTHTIALLRNTTTRGKLKNALFFCLN